MITLHLDEAQVAKIVAACPEVAEKLVAALASMQATPRPEFYSVAEAAALTGMCRKTIERRIAAKVIPVIPGYRRHRIPSSYIERLSNP